MAQEEWRDIPGFEGRYQASTHGRVRSVDQVREVIVNGKMQIRHYKGRILRAGKSADGHLSVVLGRRYGSMPVHTAVALAFIGPRPDGFDVCHNDGDPTNNHIENLRYDTRTNNILDVYRQGGSWRKLSLNDMRGIKELLNSGISGHSIAKKYGVSDTTVSRIKLKRGATCKIL